MKSTISAAHNYIHFLIWCCEVELVCDWSLVATESSLYSATASSRYQTGQDLASGEEIELEAIHCIQVKCDVLKN